MGDEAVGVQRRAQVQVQRRERDEAQTTGKADRRHGGHHEHDREQPARRGHRERQDAQERRRLEEGTIDRVVGQRWHVGEPQPADGHEEEAGHEDDAEQPVVVLGARREPVPIPGRDGAAAVVRSVIGGRVRQPLPPRGCGAGGNPPPAHCRRRCCCPCHCRLPLPLPAPWPCLLRPCHSSRPFLAWSGPCHLDSRPRRPQPARHLRPRRRPCRNRSARRPTRPRRARAPGACRGRHRSRTDRGSRRRRDTGEQWPVALPDPDQIRGARCPAGVVATSVGLGEGERVVVGSTVAVASTRRRRHPARSTWSPPPSWRPVDRGAVRAGRRWPRRPRRPRTGRRRRR